jgi:hypothetical protein
MTQQESQPDGSAPVNRRDLMRLGAALLGAPLLTPPATPHAAPDPPTQVRAEATPLSDFMGLAMHNLAAANGSRFPAAAIKKGDKAILSWRVAILPYLEQFALYQRFHLDEAWDSPHNASLLIEMPRVYAPVTPGETTAHTTHYQRVVGPGSLFDRDERTRVDVNVFRRPALLIVEAANSVPWTKPEDLPYDDGKPLLRLGGPFEDGSYATFADGSVRFLSREHSPETLRALITQRRT